MKEFLLFIFPLAIIITHLIGSVLFTAYRFYFPRIGATFYEEEEEMRIRTDLKLTYCFRVFFFFLGVFHVYFFSILTIYDFRFKMFYINNLIMSQLHVYTLIFFLILYFFQYIDLNLGGVRYPIDFFIFLVSLYCTSFTLLVSNNLLTVFICLEIINVLIIYSFLLNINLNWVDWNRFNQKTSWLIGACVYQYILNFFSSILFFFSFNMVASYTCATNFWMLTHFDVIYHNWSIYLVLLYISFFFKFGIGPWIFFKLQIYQGFNYILLTIYTIVYFSTILTFFFNLFFIYFLPINYIVMVILLAIMLLIGVVFTIKIFSYFNMLMFFSFSSLINLLFLIIQWTFIIIFVYYVMFK